jgi:hypothetical protein
MRTNTQAVGLPANGTISGGVALTSSATNFWTGTATLTGYGVVFNPAAAGGVQLVRYASGLQGTPTVIIAASGTYTATNYYSVKVTYYQPTNTWTLYLRDDGSSGFADPITGGGAYTQIGTVVNATNTGSAVTGFGWGSGFTTGAGKNQFFDNFNVNVAPVITYTALSSTGCPNDRTITATVTAAATSGATMPRIYYIKISGAYVSSPGTYVSGTTYNFTISASALGGLAASDVVSYYIIAQESSTGLGVISIPYAGLVATSVNSVTTPPTTPNTYTVIAGPSAITGTTTLCAAGATTTLADASTPGTWASSASGTASIDASGVVTSSASGSATITFTQTSTGCYTTTARFNSYNIMSSAGLYSKQLYIPQEASQYTVQVQRKCANPVGALKPFPFAANNGTTGSVGTQRGAGSQSASGPPPPITTPTYLTPPAWYVS